MGGCTSNRGRETSSAGSIEKQLVNLGNGGGNEVRGMINVWEKERR